MSKLSKEKIEQIANLARLELSEEEKKPIREALEKQFLSMFTKLQVLQTKEKIQSYV